LLGLSVMKVRPVTVVMSGAADDVSCVVFHDECPGLGAKLCGVELVVAVVARTENCSHHVDQKLRVVSITSRRRDHVGVTNMGGGIYEWRIPPRHS
jgi:hypothetical protein